MPSDVGPTPNLLHDILSQRLVEYLRGSQETDSIVAYVANMPMGALRI
jgi:hypothetical protein